MARSSRALLDAALPGIRLRAVTFAAVLVAVPSGAASAQRLTPSRDEKEGEEGGGC